MDKPNNAGDFIVKGGDGNEFGKGGDVHLGPGIYKAGDVIVKQEASLLGKLLMWCKKLFSWFNK